MKCVLELENSEPVFVAGEYRMGKRPAKATFGGCGYRSVKEELFLPMYARRPAVLLCTFCGREIVPGQEYWVCSGSCVCVRCLPELARRELAPCREVRGREVRR